MLRLYVNSTAKPNLGPKAPLSCACTDLWAGESHGAIRALFTLKKEGKKKKKTRSKILFNSPSAFRSPLSLHRLPSQSLSEPRAARRRDTVSWSREPLFLHSDRMGYFGVASMRPSVE